MANKNQIKMKKVAFINKLVEGHPTQYKLAMVTPVVVTRDKFIENVSAHTGLNKHIVRSVIDSIGTKFIPTGRMRTRLAWA